LKKISLDYLAKSELDLISVEKQALDVIDEMGQLNAAKDPKIQEERWNHVNISLTAGNLAFLESLIAQKGLKVMLLKFENSNLNIMTLNTIVQL
jgi:hypothetical protein